MTDRHLREATVTRAVHLTGRAKIDAIDSMRTPETHHGAVSSVNQPPELFRHGATELLSGFDPFACHTLDGGERSCLGGAVRYGTEKLGDFGDKGFVFRAPVNDDFVLHASPQIKPAKEH